MFNPLGAVFSTAVAAGKGLVEGAEEGIKTGNRGSIFDLVTVPVGAVTGAFIGTTAGATVGVITNVENDIKVLKNPQKPVEWNPIKYTDRTLDRMDEVPWREEIVRPATKGTNAAAIGATIGAASCAGVGLVAGTALTATSVATSAGTGAVAGVLREVDSQMTSRR